ncbi:MAG: alkaline phosphatase D family protein [Nitrospirae bacterium]|nr:alkaline phosphatase D family protein [Nitrospirota bacterium]
MMKLSPLTVGPIIRGAIGDSIRLWGSGEYQATSKHSPEPKRCVGVARIRQKGEKSFGQPTFFKMNPNFDMTGVVVFSGLESETLYEYQMGWCFSVQDLLEKKSKVSLNWDAASRGTVTTASTQSTQPRSFIFGSCRNLLLLFGRAWYDNRGDKTFRSMLNQIEAGDGCDAVLMIGDQIYADDLNYLKMDDTLDQFNTRYRLAFSQPHIQRLMANVPTYMTLDDHEIEDNWPAKAEPKDWVTKYPAAMHSYMTYQMSGNPLFTVNAQNKLEGVPEKLWYVFTDGCCDVFVMDTRTERNLESEPKELVSREQLQALKDWLNDGSGKVKLVASPIPLFPDHKTESPDKWGGFLEQRGEVLNHIREYHIPRVVFLSGDIHCSMTAEVVSPSDPTFKVISIISSAFFWPYSHPKPSMFNLEGTLPTAGDGDYTLANVALSMPWTTLPVSVLTWRGSPPKCMLEKGNTFEPGNIRFKGMLKKAASGVLWLLPDLRARRLGALRRSRSRTGSTRVKTAAALLDELF